MILVVSYWCLWFGMRYCDGWLLVWLCCWWHSVSSGVGLVVSAWLVVIWSLAAMFD